MRGIRGAVGLVALGLVFIGGCTSCKRFAYSGPGRDGWQKPDQVMAALAPLEAKQVADLGAGGGYFTFRLADAVGSQGTVYAVDVDPDMTEYLSGRVREEGRENVRIVLAEFEDPKLPPGGIDLILTVNTYHHLQDRTAYFARAAGALRPGGRIAVIEFDGRGGLFSRFFDHKTDPGLIKDEMEAAGFRLAEAPEFLERQSFLIFARE
jgi:ubiquinone/menaquinone biosynthesis C-methylase UbiE